MTKAIEGLEEIMERRPRGVDRRTFVKTLAVTAVGSRVAGAAIPQDKTISVTGSIPARALGKTGHTLPVLGMGGAVLQHKHAGLVAVPPQTDEARIEMIRHGYQRGLRYVDTARGYGESESLIGAALRDVRDDVYIATKVWALEPAAARKSVESSLEQLGTDYVDAMQIHGPTLRRLGFDGGMKVRDELDTMRGEGKLRFIGLTGHDNFELMYRLIATGGFDQLLIAYGYFRKGMLNMFSNEEAEWRDLCIAKAHQLGMGIVAMKVMGCYVYGHASGRVVPSYDGAARARLPGAAIRWVLSDPRISILNIGVCLESDIDSNIEAVSGDAGLTDADRLLLGDFSRQAYESPSLRHLHENRQWPDAPAVG
jgi:predicted aldo/keto reductase-like oxidoreductase